MPNLGGFAIPPSWRNDARTLSLADGASLTNTSWSDSGSLASGHSTLNTSVGSVAPTYKAVCANGLPGVVCTDSSYPLLSPSAFSGTGAFAVFAVVKSTDTLNNGNFPSVVLQSAGATDMILCPVNQSLLSGTSIANGNNYYGATVLWLLYDGANLYLGNSNGFAGPVAKASRSAFAALSLFNYDGSGTLPFIGNAHDLLYYDLSSNAMTTSDAQAIVADLVAEWNMEVNPPLVVAGDSISVLFWRHMGMVLAQYRRMINFGVSGTSSSTIAAGASTYATAFVAGKRGNLFIANGGTNDFGSSGAQDATAAASNMQTLFTAMKTAGAETVGQTITDRTDGGASASFLTLRSTMIGLQTAWSGSVVSALVRVDLDSHLGVDPCANDTTYFEDNLHPTSPFGAKYLSQVLVTGWGTADAAVMCTPTSSFSAGTIQLHAGVVTGSGAAPYTYLWSITSAPSGSTATLSSTTVENPTLTPDKGGDYVFSVTVTDSSNTPSDVIGNVTQNASLGPTFTPPETNADGTQVTFDVTGGSGGPYTSTAVLGNFTLSNAGSSAFSQLVFSDPTYTLLLNRPILDGQSPTIDIDAGVAADSTSEPTGAVSGQAITNDSDTVAATISPTITPDPVTGRTAVPAFNVSGGFGNHPIKSIAFTASPAGSSPVVAQDPGTGAYTLIFDKASDTSNDYTVLFSYSDDTASLTHSVSFTVDQTATSVTLTPTTARLSDTATQDYDATALDQFGNPLASQPTFDYSIPVGGGSFTSNTYESNGLFAIVEATIHSTSIHGTAVVNRKSAMRNRSRDLARERFS